MFHGSGGEKTFLQTTCMFHSGGCIFSYVNTFSKGVTVITMSLANPISPVAILKVYTAKSFNQLLDINE